MWTADSFTKARSTVLGEIAPLVSKLASGQPLSRTETADTFEIISREDTEGYFYLAFAVGLMARGPLTEELLGLVEGLQRFAKPLDVAFPASQLIDVSGSGGDSIKTFNVSTAAALVAAACGQHVVKQSFRAFTSHSGSSDALSDLGVQFPNTSADAEILLNAVGIVPLNFATSYEGMNARLTVIAKLREIGLQFPTPMHPVALIPCPIPIKRRVYGLYSANLLRPVAEIFAALGYERALVVHGEPGLDEVSTLGPTKVCELNNNHIHEYEIVPADLGLPLATASEVAVNSRKESVDTLLKVLVGQSTEAQANLVAANAGAGLLAGGRVDTWRQGVEEATQAIANGSAFAVLKKLVAMSAGEEGSVKLEQRLQALAD